MFSRSSVLNSNSKTNLTSSKPGSIPLRKPAQVTSSTTSNSTTPAASTSTNTTTAITAATRKTGLKSTAVHPNVNNNESLTFKMEEMMKEIQSLSKQIITLNNQLKLQETEIKDLTKKVKNTNNKTDTNIKYEEIRMNNIQRKEYEKISYIS